MRDATLGSAATNPRRAFGAPELAEALASVAGCEQVEADQSPHFAALVPNERARVLGFESVRVISG